MESLDDERRPDPKSATEHCEQKRDANQDLLRGIPARLGDE